MSAPPDFRCNHKAAAPSSPTPSFSAKGAPGGGVDAKASGEESQQWPDALHQLCGGAYVLFVLKLFVIIEECFFICAAVTRK